MKCDCCNKTAEQIVVDPKWVRRVAKYWIGIRHKRCHEHKVQDYESKLVEWTKEEWETFKVLGL